MLARLVPSLSTFALLAAAVVSCAGEPPRPAPDLATEPRLGASKASNGSNASASASRADRAAPTASASGAASTSAPTPPATARAAARGDSLPGLTLDFDDDGAGAGGRDRAYSGRIFVPERALDRTESLPLVVFFHGLNRELIPHRWMGGGNEGDVRRIVGELVGAGTIEPALLAGPGSVAPAAVSRGASFPAFDLTRFLDRVDERLRGTARVDRSRIVVVGHSGAGCSERGGIVTARSLEPPPLAVVSIDTCMGGTLATALAGASPRTHVVVTWQTASWERNFRHFRDLFEKERGKHPEDPGVARALEQLPALPRAHDATVAQTLDRWLPRLLPPRPEGRAR